MVSNILDELIVNFLDANLSIYITCLLETGCNFYVILWLSQHYVGDLHSRVKCSDLLNHLAEKFANISLRESGFVVRRCFPYVKRVHSNHKYYFGIRRVCKTKEALNPSIKKQSKFTVVIVLSSGV